MQEKKSEHKSIRILIERGSELKKVLLLSRPFINSVQGTGEQLVAREIANELIQNYKTYIKLTYVHRMMVNPYKSVASVIFYDYIVTLTFSFINLLKPYDLVIFNSPYQAAFAWFFRLRRKHTVCIIHDFTHLGLVQTGLFAKYSSAIYPIAINNCDKLIMATVETQQTLKRKHNRIGEVVPLGVEKGLSEPDFSAIKPGNSVGYIGAYSVRKRPDRILDLMKSGKAGHLTLSLAGRIPAELENEFRIVANANKISLHILGEVTDVKKDKFYKEISYLYFPTTLEAFGLPIAEAFRTGSIPIVHRDAVIPKLLKDHCLLIDCPDEIYDIVARFEHDRNRYVKILRENFELASAFTWPRFVSKLIAPLLSKES